MTFYDCVSFYHPYGPFFNKGTINVLIVYPIIGALWCPVHLPQKRLAMKTLSKLKIIVRRNQKLIVECFRFLLFAICLAWVLILGIQCFDKYLSYQQSTEIYFQPASDHGFPSFTFCPLQENQDEDLSEPSNHPKPFNETRLRGNLLSCAIFTKYF